MMIRFLIIFMQGEVDSATEPVENGSNTETTHSQYRKETLTEQTKNIAWSEGFLRNLFLHQLKQKIRLG
jgi:hypothetical protein